MSYWLQAVVAATCIIVVSVAGYFGYKEYSERRLLQAQALSRGELFASARAEPHEQQKVRNYCADVQRYSRSENAVGKDEAAKTIKKCSEFGYL